MCGFSGIISKKTMPISLLNESLKSIKHRGPDDTLLFDGDNQRLYASDLSAASTLARVPSFTPDIFSQTLFGFNRLSIVDLSSLAMQPFFDKERQILFMLNGEVYNYQALKTQYLSDISFISQSDSEVAFRLYLRLGNSFVEYLQGMFSILVYDFKRRVFRAWRDRMGMKPFYYSFSEGTFIFSSEMKGIFATQKIAKKQDYTGLAYSMYLGTCPAPLTIYQDVFSLPAAHFLEFSFDNQSITTKAYWHLTYTPNPTVISAEEMSQDLRDLAKLHLTGDVNKSVMLSGGMDSGLLAKFIAEQDASLQALNIYTQNHSTDEREYALANAQNAGINLLCFEIPAAPSIPEIEKYLCSEEEPNAAPEPAYFLSEKAKDLNFLVLYNALGFDELFGGYGYYTKIKKMEKWLGLAALLPSFLLPRKYQSKLKDLKKFGALAFPFIGRQTFSWDEVRAFLQKNQQPLPIHPLDFLLKQAEMLYPDFQKMPTLKKTSWLDFHYYIASHHTFRSDQPSMKHSIEMRFPFLDHLFVQKYFNEVGTFVGIAQTLKPKLRAFAEKHLPEKVLQMPKKGFTMPTEKWLAVLNGSVQNPNQYWYMLCLDRLKMEGK